MAGKLGIRCKLYRGTSSFGVSFSEIKAVTDATINGTYTEANATTRGAYPVEIVEPVLLQAQIDFTILAIEGDADFAAIREAWRTKSAIELMALDGDRETPGSEGYHGEFKITQMTRGEPMGEFATYQCVAKPCISTNGVEWVVIE